MPLILPDATNHPTLVSDTSNIPTSALHSLSADTLQHEIRRLQHSIQRLYASNHQIQHFCHTADPTDLSEPERVEMHNACSDNLVTIDKQQMLVQRLVGVLSEKTGGNGTQSHYAAVVDPILAPAQTEAPSQPTQTAQADHQQDQGVFL